jgi:hypothetical protein
MREELREASGHIFNTLVRVGIHLAKTPVSQLPEESREHFMNAAREFARGLSTLAHELANTVEKVSEEVSMNGEKAAEKDVRCARHQPRSRDLHGWYALCA